MINRLYLVASIIVIALSLLFACLRIYGLKGELFQGFAHIYVGGLIGGWIVLKIVDSFDMSPCSHPEVEDFLFWNWVILSVIEVACFFLLK